MSARQKGDGRRRDRTLYQGPDLGADHGGGGGPGHPLAPASRGPSKGREGLYRRLQEVDPTTAARLHPHDTYRIIRALEVYERTGRPISALRQRHLFQEEPYQALKIGLTRSGETCTNASMQGSMR